MAVSQIPEAKLGNETSIRILTLLPGKEDEPLAGELHAVPIAQAGAYEALSCVWSNTSRPRKISCQGVKVGITESLYRALSRARCVDSERRIWADQICVNQDDLEERSQQVQLMNTIYKNAGRVLVWLGDDESGDAEKARELLNGLNGDVHDLEEEKHFREDGSVRWSSLRNLTRLPWFSRAWIVQEVGTNSNAVLLWGQTEIDWHSLYAACEKLVQHDRFRRQLGMRTAEIKYIHQRFVEPERTSRQANRFSFVYELHRARHLKVSDPRDRVYAFLGHYSIRKGENVVLQKLRPDYSRTVHEVYADVAARALQDGQDPLITLAAVQHTALPSKQSLARGTRLKNEHLPTWVPDWRSYQSHILSEPTSPHYTSKHAQASFVVYSDGRSIIVEGVEVDTISICSHSIRARTFHSQGKRFTAEETIRYLWRRICQRSGPLSLEHQYLDGEPMLLALMQTLSNGGAPIWWRELAQNGVEHQSYHDVTVEEWLAYSASALASISMSDDFMSPNIREIANTANKDAYSWIGAADWASSNRCLARSSKGFLVLGPAVMEEGDVICVLFGGKLPFCLRPWNGRYLVVGECYVHGLAAGEVDAMIQANAFEISSFEIV